MRTSVFKTPGSSLFSEVSYDGDSGILLLTFRKDGSQRAYPEVSPELWARFLRSESKGNFYSAHIRGKFKGAIRVPEPPAVEAVPDHATGGES